MKTVKMLVQVMFQGYVEVDIPTQEEIISGAEPEVRIDPAQARTSHMLAVVTGHEPEDERVFAGQLALNALSVMYAKQVAEGTEHAIRARQAKVAPTFVMPEGKA